MAHLLLKSETASASLLADHLPLDFRTASLRSFSTKFLASSTSRSAYACAGGYRINLVLFVGLACPSCRVSLS
jgi:hypothetical protein